MRYRGEALENIVDDVESLRHEISTLRAILDSLTEGVIVADQDGRFIYFNPVAERILGIGLQDIAPNEWTATYGCYRMDKVTPYPSEELPLARSIRGEEVLDEVIFIRNPKQPGGVWISTSSSPYLDEEGSVSGGVVIFREIMEKQFRERYERLARAV